MVRDGQPLVIRKQGIVGAEQPSHGGGVMDRGVEVGVVTHVRRDPVLHGSLRNEPRAQLLRRRRVRAQRRRQGGPQRRMGRRSEAHESIEHRLCARGEGARGESVEQAQPVQCAQVQHLIADGDTAAEALPAARAPEGAERQVLNRKIAGGRVRGADPTAQRRVVRGVDRVQRHVGAAQAPRRPRGAAGAASGAKCFFRPRHTWA